MTKISFLVLFSIIAFSCRKLEGQPFDENIYFFEPQPKNISELNKIPSRFRGKFMSQDSLFYNIEDNFICFSYCNKFKVAKSEIGLLKSDFEITDKKIISKKLDIAFGYRFLKDSIELSEVKMDTVFVFSKNNKAKRIDGQLVLNFKDRIYWQIKIISIQQNVLTIKQLSDFADLKRLDSITAIKSKMIDSTKILLNPSRFEFKKIVNLKNSGFSANYKKI